MSSIQQKAFIKREISIAMGVSNDQTYVGGIVQGERDL